MAEQLPAEDVLFGLRGKQSEARRCFEQHAAEGLVRLRWSVAMDGQVTEIDVATSTLDDHEVTHCLTEFVRNLHYDRRSSTAVASWTFVRGVGDETVLERAAKRERELMRNPKKRALADQASRNDGVALHESSVGRLSLDEIENVTEHGFRLYAFCMREGLNRNVRLSGRVLLDFTINTEGRVTEVSDAGSDLPDLQVIDCIAEAFYAMHFPRPKGGSVRLAVPILLNEK